jgi:hypothetical protein
MSELSKKHKSSSRAFHINIRSRLSAQPAPNNSLQIIALVWLSTDPDIPANRCVTECANRLLELLDFAVLCAADSSVSSLGCSELCDMFMLLLITFLKIIEV